jgi:hypothetical protein
MLDENGDEVTSKENITIDGADVDGNGYASQPAESNIKISFSESDLKNLNQTRSMKLDITLNTPDQQAVRIRKDDSVSLQIQIKADISSTVN